MCLRPYSPLPFSHPEWPQLGVFIAREAVVGVEKNYKSTGAFFKA